MDEWKQILKWSEKEINDLRFIGYSYLKQGIYPTALTFFNALLALNPDSAFDLSTLGALHLQMGNGISALDCIDRALRLDPQNLLVQLNRAKALFLLGYRRQGLLQASELEKSGDPLIADQASALLLAYK